MSSKRSVIIFGPSGEVGGAAAVEAHKRGAKVWLAMRDTSKHIPNLGAELQRVHADLTQPETLKEAVKHSGATCAFIYMVTTNDHMRASIDALKEAGIQHIVFLSSFSVDKPPREVQEDNYIPFVHARVEVSLQDSGISFTAVRPAFFSSNIKGWHADEIRKGHVKIFKPDAVFDYIAPIDIGAVCGSLLTADDTPPQIVYLCGPKLMNSWDAYAVISERLGHKVEIESISEEAYIAKNNILPDIILQSLLKGMKGDQVERYRRVGYEEAVSNIPKYAGRDPTEFSDWVDKNLK